MGDKTRIAIAIGDPAGIGPEVSLKAAQDPAVRRACRPVLVGDARVLQRHATACRIPVNLHVIARVQDADWSADCIDVLDCAQTDLAAVEFGTVRSDLQALIDHAGSGSTLRPIPVKPTEVALRALELARLSPLAEWHYKTAHKDSFVDVSRAQRELGYAPRFSNEQALIRTYDWYLAHRSEQAAAGTTHRVPWNQQALPR